MMGIFTVVVDDKATYIIYIGSPVVGPTERVHCAHVYLFACQCCSGLLHEALVCQY